jgi:hypothetical protein
MNTRFTRDRRALFLNCFLGLLLFGAQPLLLFAFQNAGSQQTQAEPRTFGGTFETLQPARNEMSFVVANTAVFGICYALGWKMPSMY